MVVPSDSGIKDPIWKCMKRKRRRAIIKENELSSIETDTAINNKPLLQENPGRVPVSDDEDTSSAMYHEPFYNPQNLKVKFIIFSHKFLWSFYMKFFLKFFRGQFS